jgi:hypothetical protein
MDVRRNGLLWKAFSANTCSYWKLGSCELYLSQEIFYPRPKLRTVRLEMYEEEHIVGSPVLAT